MPKSLLVLTAILWSDQVLATGAIYPGDTVRDRARAGTAVTSERSVSALTTNPGLLGKTDNLELQFEWTQLGDRSQVTRKGPFYSSSFNENEPDNASRLEATMNTSSFSSSLGKSVSDYQTSLLRAGLSYGFGTKGFRIALSLSDLPVQNHNFDSGAPVRYRLLASADRVRQLSAGLGYAGNSFGLGVAVHINQVDRARRMVLSALDKEAPENGGLFLERPFNDYSVDVAGSLQHAPQFGLGLWLRPFGKFELGFSMQLAAEGQTEAGTAQLDVSAISTEQRGAVFARTRVAPEEGQPSTETGNAATIRDGLPLRMRVGFRYQFKRWDLEGEFKLEQWSGATALSMTAPSQPGSVHFIPDPNSAQDQIPLGNFGDARSFEDAQSYHIASRIWLVPDGVALHLGYSLENPSTLQPDAALIDGSRHGFGLGLSLIDRGYAIDFGYLLVTSTKTTINNGSLTLRNPRLGDAPAPEELAELTIQNNGDYQLVTSFFGIGARADVSLFQQTRNAEREAWYRVWTKGSESLDSDGL